MAAGRRVSWAVPFLVAAGAACGGSDVEDGAFGGNGGTGATSSTTAAQTAQAVAVSSASSAQATTSGGAGGPGSGGAGEGGTGDGGTGPGSGGAGDGGAGGADAQGGSSSEGGGGGASPGFCDDDCDFAGDGEGDCDDDGDPNAEDCQPCDALVFSDQEAFFGEPYATLEGDTSFDYDCSGETELEYPYDADGCAGFNPQNCPDQASVISGDDAPVCGETATVEGCEVTGAVVGVAGTCADADSSEMVIRCR